MPNAFTNHWNSIDEIATVMRSCTSCILHAERKQAVPGIGSANARILIIGEGPGSNEALKKTYYD